MTIKTINTFCRTCSGHCGMEVDVENGRIVEVRGDKEHLLTKGYFCIKGYASADLHNNAGADRRLMNTQKRLDDGSFRDVDVEIALDEIAEKLRHVIAMHGAESLAVWTGTSSYMGSGILTTQGLIKSLMSELGTPNLFSGMTLDQSAKWVTMLRMGAFGTGKRQVHQLDALMLVGANPVVSHQGSPVNSASAWNPGKSLREAKRNGMKLIVVDPRQTETARLADIHLQIIPGEDAALMAGMIKIILDNNRHEKAFCDQFVEHLDALRAAVADFDLETVSRRTGIAAELIAQAAQILGQAKRISVGSGTGSNMAPNCNLAEHLTEALNAIRGGYKRAGETLATPGFINRNSTTECVYPPTRSWTAIPHFSAEGAGRMMGEFPSALLPQAILDGKIKALIVIGGNPALAISDPHKTQAALKQLDLLVTLDPRMTETGELSDYVIAPVLPFEKHDVPVLIESWAPIPFLQYAPPALEKPAGAIEDWEFAWGLAKRMGVQLTLKVAPYGADYGLIPGGLKIDMVNKPDNEQLLRWACSNAPISYDELKKYPSGISPDTPPVVIQPADKSAIARLDLMPDDVLAELQAYSAKSNDKNFGYLLTCRRLLENMNSAFRLNERTTEKYETSRLFMHPDDMTRAGFASGQAVAIQSKHGTISGRLAEDKTLRPGVVSMAHLWSAVGTSKDGHTGNLISIEPAHLSKFNYMPQQSAIPVNVVGL